MKIETSQAIAIAALLLAIGGASAEEPRAERVQFAQGRDNAVLTGRITGEKAVLYRFSAREGEFLSVSLRPDNQSAHYNIYIPGRGPGDEALFSSDTGGREYTGELYKTGDHTVSVFLNRNAARKGEVANYDIVFRITDKSAGRLPAEVPPAAASAHPATPAPLPDAPWDKVTIEKADHAPLLQRQATLTGDLARTPVTIALLVLEPDLSGVVTALSTDYDTMESPSEVNVTVTESGILDDDLFGRRHVISLARNRNNEWRVVEYARGELRRASFN